MQLVTLFFYNHDLEKKPSFGTFPKKYQHLIISNLVEFLSDFLTLWSVLISFFFCSFPGERKQGLRH